MQNLALIGKPYLSEKVVVFFLVDFILESQLGFIFLGRSKLVSHMKTYQFRGWIFCLWFTVCLNRGSNCKDL